jgi:hypothetical protein
MTVVNLSQAILNRKFFEKIFQKVFTGVKGLRIRELPSTRNFTILRKILGIC